LNLGESCCSCGSDRKRSENEKDSGAQKRFVWNDYLQYKLIVNNINHLWKLDIIHGYINQSCINFGVEKCYVTLIARRSNKFAGTRFLKRGCNDKGEVANDVETEQIVSNNIVTSLSTSVMTSYVQHRGSIPLHWSQDITANVVPAKPPICMTSDNAYGQSTGLHFSELMQRYGTPVTVLDLVKKRDKKAKESMLGQEYKTTVEFLNQFVRNDYQIYYNAVDMAHLLKGTNIDVVARLEKIAERSIQKTGFFQSKPDLVLPDDGRVNDPKWMKLGGVIAEGCRIQTGVLRSNCVDCLDRTNSAQIVAAKCALAYQLFSLGIIDKIHLHFDTDAMRMFCQMFEIHGNIIALQYGGSLLVHTIQSYRRIGNPWSSHSRDIVTTLSRYYSNTFSDADKQAAINLFLGIYKPPSLDSDVIMPHLWEMTTDDYLHNTNQSSKCNPSHWWKSSNYHYPLPIAIGNMLEMPSKKLQFCCSDCSDWFDEFHRTSQLTSFDDCFLIKIDNTRYRSIQAGYEDLNPFIVRKTESSTQNEDKDVLNKTTDILEDFEDYASDYTSSSAAEDTKNFEQINRSDKYCAPWLEKPTLENFSSKAFYGIDLKVSSENIKLYENYVKNINYKNNFEILKTPDIYKSVEIPEPKVDERSMIIYKNSVNKIFKVDQQFYQDYIDKFRLK